ncbi:MAG: hypothetical protein Q9159_005299 [Coniocarpon cinnabarinum]
MSNEATRLEELLWAEVINLRGQPSPTMRAWNRSPHKKDQPEFAPSLKPNTSLSPSGNRCAVESRHDPSQGQITDQRSSNLVSKKRKVLNFDTPKTIQPGLLAKVNTRENAWEAQRHGSDKENDSRVPQQLTGHEKDHRTSPAFNDHQAGHSATKKSDSCEASHDMDPKSLLKNSLLNATVTAQSTTSRLQQSCETTLWSTQAALIEAQMALREESPSHKANPVSLSGSVSQLFTPTSRTPPRSPAAPPTLSAQAFIGTQHLFDQTLHFGTPSPLKQQESAANEETMKYTSDSITSNDPWEPQLPDQLTSPPCSEPDVQQQPVQSVRESVCGETALPSTPQKINEQCRTPESKTTTMSPALFSKSSKTGRRGSDESPRHPQFGAVDMDMDAVFDEATSILGTWRT